MILLLGNNFFWFLSSWEKIITNILFLLFEKNEVFHASDWYTACLLFEYFIFRQKWNIKMECCVITNMKFQDLKNEQSKIDCLNIPCFALKKNIKALCHIYLNFLYFWNSWKNKIYAAKGLNIPFFSSACVEHSVRNSQNWKLIYIYMFPIVLIFLFFFLVKFSLKT